MRYREYFKHLQKWEIDTIEFETIFKGTRRQVKQKEKELIELYSPPANTSFLDKRHRHIV